MEHKQRTIMNFECAHKLCKTDVQGTLVFKKMEMTSNTFATLLFTAFHGTVDDEGETVDDWIHEWQGMVSGKYGALLHDMSFALYDKQELIGCIVCSEFKGVPLILYVAVAPDYRGKRYAAALIEKVLEAGVNRAFPAVYLVVSNDNESAVKAYQRIGFTAAGHTWEDVLADR